MPYERTAKVTLYTPEAVFAHIGPDDYEFDGDSIHMDSLRYQVFQKSCVCVTCGLEGTYFAKERAVGHGGKLTNGTRYHFNLYGINVAGEEVMFTKDHILPKSKKGTDALENLQTMCCPCNLAKRNILEGAPTEAEILEQALVKHPEWKQLNQVDLWLLYEFLRHVRDIGYNEGFSEGKKKR